MTITQISFVVQLDTEAVQGYLSLAGWAAHLDVDAVEPTWDDIYRELGRILIGAPHYQRFCRTARSDVKDFTGFKLYDSIQTQTPAPPGFEMPDKPEPEKAATPPPRVTTPPLPATRKAGATA